MTVDTVLGIFILIASGFLLWGLTWLWRHDFMTRTLSPTATIVLRGASRFLVMSTAGIIALRLFGIDSATVFASISALILVIAVGFFAVWSVLSNIFCAGLLLFYAPFRIEDEIEILEPGKDYWIRGKVLDINMFFVTILETHTDGTESINRVPNNLIMQKVVRRWPGHRTHSLAEAMNNTQPRNAGSNKPTPSSANPDNDLGIGS